MISVALCTYNGERYIRDQLDSILSQTMTVDEIIIRDDCSRDSTCVILEDYASRYPQIDFKTLYPVLVMLNEIHGDLTLLDKAQYSESVKNAIKEFILNLKSSTKTANDKSLKDLDVEAETVRLYESMKNIENLGNLEEKEKIQLIKLQTSTLSDLLNMVKEAQEIKKIREFEDLIFGILTDEQKEKVKRLFD